MNEQRRLEYLQAMGISQYVPRWVLPAARASAAADLPAIVTEATDTAANPVEASGFKANAYSSETSAFGAAMDLETWDEAPETASQPRAIAGVVSNLMDVLAPTPKGQVRALHEGVQPRSSSHATLLDVKTQAQTSEHPANIAAVVAPFALSIWRPTPALMVIDSRQNRQALPTLGLLQNILTAKGIHGFAAKPDVLNWPPVSGVHNTGGWTAAREMTQAFLQARLDLAPAKYLWLMGESAFRAVVEGDQTHREMLGQAVNLESLATLALVLPGLADMLLNPSVKAITWAAIRAHDIGRPLHDV